MSVPNKEDPLTCNVKGEKTKHKVDLESVLVEDIGQFGWFQLQVMVVGIIVSIFSTWSALEYVFTTARINSRCLIPECDSSSPEFDTTWVHNAIPGSPGALDNCQRFVGNYSQLSGNQTCPAELFDQNRVEVCKEYVYDNTDTVVYDYDLACDEWRRTLIGSIRAVGVVLALPITGYISDHWGRRTALTICAVNNAWVGITRYWAGTYEGFIISELIEAIVGSGGFSCIYILIMELVGHKYRVAAGATLNTCSSLGQMAMGLIAWHVPNWRKLTLALYIPQLLTISYFWIITESVRWYISKGRYEEAEVALQKIVEKNKTKLSSKSLESLRRFAEEEKNKNELEKELKTKEPWLIELVFRHKKILLRCILSPVWWVTNTFIYYGLGINSVNISGHRHLNYIAVAAVDIPGYWTAVFLMDKIGRKPVLAGAFWICAACQVAYIFLPTGFNGLSLTFYLIGKYSIAIVMTSVYVYTAELYPTRYRHRLFAFSSMVGRLGAIIAPLTPAFGASTFDEFPFVLFGSFALLSGILMFLTPETLGTKLPDTMEEAESLEKKFNTTEKKTYS